MRAAFLAPILPWVMQEGESKKAALILIRHYGTGLNRKWVWGSIILKLQFLKPLKENTKWAPRPTCNFLHLSWFSAGVSEAAVVGGFCESPFQELFASSPLRHAFADWPPWTTQGRETTKSVPGWPIGSQTLLGLQLLHSPTFVWLIRPWYQFLRLLKNNQAYKA